MKNVSKIAKEILAQESVKGFLITIPEGSAKEWASKTWDTYGFDYDMNSITLTTVFIWPLEDTAYDELEKTLMDEDIQFIATTRRI